MKRCVIITAYNESKIADAVDIQAEDFVVCADGGYDLAIQEGIIPDLVIGDKDSGSVRQYACENICVPVEKDDTDTMLCVKHGIEQGCTYFIIVGGIGGRIDHTLANIQTLAYALTKGVFAELRDAKNRAFIFEDEAVIPYTENAKLSLFAYSEECTGVTVKGAKYPLDDAVLKHDFPLGVSNEFEDKCVTVSVKTGKMLAVISSEN